MQKDREVPATEVGRKQVGRRPTNDELVDDLMERAGGISTFHVLFYFAISAGCNNVRAFLNHMIPFLIQKQVYKCQLVDDAVVEVDAHDEICTQENICAGDARIHSWAVDYDNNRSLHNWVQ